MKEIGPKKDYLQEGIYHIEIDGNDLLLINHDKFLYCIENKCGHFGLPLEKGRIKDKKIFCPAHNISFSLATGEVKDHMGEQCDPVKTIKLSLKDGVLYCDV